MGAGTVSHECDAVWVNIGARLQNIYASSEINRRLNEIITNNFRLIALRTPTPGRRTNARIIHQKRNNTSSRIQYCLWKKLGSSAISPMTENNAREASSSSRCD
jgi:hypothetical protein